MSKLEHDPLALFERWYKDDDPRWFDSPPGWRAWGARVEMDFGAGDLREGWLYVKEAVDDGEDEWPLWGVVSDGLESLSFYDAERWRFVRKPQEQ